MHEYPCADSTCLRCLERLLAEEEEIERRTRAAWRQREVD